MPEALHQPAKCTACVNFGRLLHIDHTGRLTGRLRQRLAVGTAPTPDHASWLVQPLDFGDGIAGF
jgi:hypothetical protein